ncbi:MAG: endonuclease/exonuclease/phosphatase family protein [Verrucomicrobia bacterium]|nr:endonuclease/exonuclease/phosphatase family protein [Verrucomicrobiota bacterium]
MLGVGLCAAARAADKFTVATYNLEGYRLTATETRPAKSPAARAKARESIRALHADVLALQEVGGRDAFEELQGSLKREGLDYPFGELVGGHDTNIHLAVLSRFPIARRQAYTNESFLLNGRRFHVGRGFATLDIQVNPGYRFTLLTAHLKSRRASADAYEGDLRVEEAALLRAIIDARLRAQPDLNLVALGDFNDVRDSRSVRLLIGRGKTALLDTRPAEHNGDDQPNPTPYYPPRRITWTHHFGKEDVYSRIDYILISRGMAREWNRAGTYVLAVPNWGVASDHRPILASFEAEDQ